MQVATLNITLPAAPPQSIKQDRRDVVITGSLADGIQAVQVSSTGPITIKAAIDSRVTVGTVEVLVNGKQSQPAALSFAPSDYVEAVGADPAGYAVKLVSVEEVPDAPQAQSQAESAPPNAAESATPTGRAKPIV